MSRDLRHARVYATSSESSERLEQSLTALNRAKSYIRYLLGANISMKYTPTVKFLKDEVPERSERISSLLEEASATRKG